MKVVVYTLGCKINQYESRRIAGLFEARGWTASAEPEYADAYVLNTCAVTAEAERKSRQCVSKMRRLNPNAKILVLGCASENDPAPFLRTGGSFFNANNEKMDSGASGKNESGIVGAAVKNETAADDNVFFVAGVSEKYEAASAFLDSLNTAPAAPAADSGLSPQAAYRPQTAYRPETAYRSRAAVGKTREFLKIQDGCSNFCSYCIVPVLRGAPKSVNEADIICEASASDAKEIVLSGINLSAYGADTGTGLPELLYRLSEIQTTDNLPKDGRKQTESNPQTASDSQYMPRPAFRVRLGSLEPGIITDMLLTAMKDTGACPHFHLSMQSGSDGVLKAMNRRYTASEFLKKTELIRKYFPLANITTDLICGFPGETEEEHKESLAVARLAGFGDMHVFPYSRRPGTVAARMSGHIEKAVRLSRAREAAAVRDELKEAFIKKNIGQNAVLLTETAENDKTGTGFVSGYTENYLYASVPAGQELNAFLNVKLLSYENGRLIAGISDLQLLNEV